LLLLAHLPGATAEGWPTPVTLERSLASDSPAVLIEADTGRRVRDLAELDKAARQPDEQTAMPRTASPAGLLRGPCDPDGGAAQAARAAPGGRGGRGPR